MKKRKWFLPVMIMVVIAVIIVGSVGILTSKGFGISVGRYLEGMDGTVMFVRDNSPIQMSNRTDKELFDGLDIGDKIFVIHDGIAETYPAKTGVYCVFKMSSGTTDDIPQQVVNQLIELGWLETDTAILHDGILDEEFWDSAVSYANWCELNDIYSRALNSDKMIISSVKHLPIYKFDTLTELEQFKTDVDGILSIDQSYDEVPSFNDVTVKYNEDFFEENTLILVYVDANSGSFRYGVESIYYADGNFCIHVKQVNNPEVGTDDMAGWFITVAVADSLVADCNVFDADLNNSFN